MDNQQLTRILLAAFVNKSLYSTIHKLNSNVNSEVKVLPYRIKSLSLKTISLT